MDEKEIKAIKQSVEGYDRHIQDLVRQKADIEQRIDDLQKLRAGLVRLLPETQAMTEALRKASRRENETTKYNREMDERNRISMENRDKPWLPSVDSGD